MAQVPEQLPGTLGPLRGQIIQETPNRITRPKNVIQTISAARGLYYRYRTQNIPRISLFASIEGLIAGNPPYDPIVLEQSGLAHIANFNNGDASAIYEQGALAYWNLLNQVQNIAKFVMHDRNNPDMLKYAEVMAEQFSEVVRGWPSFNMQVCTLTSQILKFGYSPVVWTDERDWRWKTVETSRFFLPDQASTDVELLTTIFLETSFTVQELYAIYEEFKDAPEDSHPWNIPELSSFLINRANTYAKFTPPIVTMMDLQMRLQNNDLAFDMLYTDEVRLVSLLQKEYDGGWSHYMFDRVWSSGTLGNSLTDGFLYFVDRQFKHIQEMLVIFTASPGVFTIHSNRGLGHKIFAPCQATMQLDCDIVNMSRLSSTPIIRSPATGAANFEPIQFKPGVPMNIGSAEFEQNQLGSNIEQLIAAGGYMLNKVKTNIAHSGDDPSVPDRNQGSISPSQARSKDFKEFSVLKNNIAHFYNQFDVVIPNMVHKMLASKKGYPGYEYAKEWRERCLGLRVPEILFSTLSNGKPRYFSVKASRVAGDGSTLALIMGLETLAPIASSFTAKGARQYQKDMVLATMGSEYVAAYVGDDEPDEISGGASLAGTENAIMKMGESPVFSPDNQQRAHITVHFELGSFVVQARQQQQMSARDADKIFSVLMPHLGEHIQAIAPNPLERSFFESIRKAWEQLSEYARLNRKNAEAELQAAIREQQEQQAETQRVLSEEELKNLQVVNEEKRKDLKVQSQVARADRANETRAEVMREKVERDAANQNLKVRLEAQTKATAEKAKAEPLPELREELSRMNGVTISPADIEV